MSLPLRVNKILIVMTIGTLVFGGFPGLSLENPFPAKMLGASEQSYSGPELKDIAAQSIAAVQDSYCVATCEFTAIVDDAGSVTFTNTSTASFEGILTIHSSNTDADENVTKAIFDPGLLHTRLEFSTHFNVSELPGPDGFLSILSFGGEGNQVDIGTNDSSILIIRQGNHTIDTTYDVTEGQWEFLQASLIGGRLDIAVDGMVVGTSQTPLELSVDSLTAGTDPRTNATLQLAHLIVSDGDLQYGYTVTEGFDESILDPSWTTTGNVYLENNEFSIFNPRESHALVPTATTTPGMAQRALNVSASSVAVELKFLAPSSGVEWSDFSLLQLENNHGVVLDVGLFDDDLFLDVTNDHATAWDVVTIEPSFYNILAVRTLGDRYVVHLNDHKVGSYRMDQQKPVNLRLGGEAGQVGYDDIRIGNVQYLIRELFPTSQVREPEEWVVVNTYEEDPGLGLMPASASPGRIRSPDAKSLEPGMVFVERAPTQPVDHFAMDFWHLRPSQGLLSSDTNHFELMTLETDTGDQFGIGFKNDSTDLFNLTASGWASSATGSFVTTGEWSHFRLSADLAAETVAVHKDGALITQGSLAGDHLAKISYGDRVNEIDLVNNRVGSGIGLWDDLTLEPLNHAPLLVVEAPEKGAKVTSGGIVTLKGTAWDPDAGDSTKEVRFRVNEGAWSSLDGTTFWTGMWNTTGQEPGEYTITIEATDGRAAAQQDVIVHLEQGA